MPEIPPTTLPDWTDGPERFRGSKNCPQHHAGVRTGYNDQCCCCNPCLYERKINFTEGCCRCTPKLICMLFTPDVSSPVCCGEIITPMIAYQTEEIDTTTYHGILGIVIKIQYDGTGCFWKIISDELGIDESFEIDHINTTCLSIPGIDIASVTLPSGCTGTVTFHDYSGVKVPFRNRRLSSLEDQAVNFVSTPEFPYPCQCYEAAAVLCVTGRRHIGGEVESVEFSWNTDLGDRWEYLPPCGNPSTDREIIFLRGHEDGRCFLEFDSEQSGMVTNDWGPYLEIDYCSCGLKVESDLRGTATDPDFTTGRYIRIHAGPCGRWQHVCGTCRCNPTTLCVIGMIEGELIQTTATWDDSDGEQGWVVLDEYDAPWFKIRLETKSCPSPRTGFSDDCAVSVETISGEFSIPFMQSSVVECGEFFVANVESVYDPYQPLAYNWLQMSSSTCGCQATSCGSCGLERCGGVPKTLIVDLLARTDPSLTADDPYDYAIDCNLSIPVQYWQRWSSTLPHTMECGYLGISDVIDCDPPFQIRIDIEDFGSSLFISKRTLVGGAWTDWQTIMSPIDVAPDTCNPYLKDTGWVVDPTTSCEWGCGLGKDEYRILVSE